MTKSKITTPKDLAHPIYEYNHPNSFTISGTTNGTTGDSVDILCYYGTTSHTYATGVPVAANGSFSTTASLVAPPFTPCTLRAIPSGTTPSSLTPFAGPRILVGFHQEWFDSSGANSGKLKDFYLFFSQLAGGFDFNSLAACGVCDGYLSEPNFAQTTVTWWSNAVLYYLISGPVLRSELQVDGANAYPPDSAAAISPSGSGLPALTYSYKQDPKTGNAIITETDPIVKCTSATYPPTGASCATFVSTGITATVTTTQDHNGRIAWTSDVFRSTDGKPHSLDLLWDNSQDFHCGGSCSGDSTLIEYEFPGEKSYSTHLVGDTVPIASGPGTVWVKVQGAADGDPITGRGAMVYDRTADKAFFRYVGKGHESFTFHQKATIPAHGSTRFRFAYVQGYKSAQVASYAQEAATIFKGCTVPNVKGKSLAAAKKTITHAGCAVGRIKHVRSANVPAGHVVSERPKAKTHLDYGTKVSLKVSNGN